MSPSSNYYTSQNNPQSSQQKISRTQHKILLILLFAISLLGLSSVFILISRASLWASIKNSSTKSAHNHACTQPEIRHEWRALSSSEKEDFIQAVNCLSTVPTTWRTNGTLYDDYAFLHGGIGSWCLYSPYLETCHGRFCWYREVYSASIGFFPALAQIHAIYMAESTERALWIQRHHPVRIHHLHLPNSNPTSIPTKYEALTKPGTGTGS